MVGRVKTYEAIVKGHNVPQSGVPESFKVLIKELQSLGLDIKVLDKNNEEINLQQDLDDEDITFRGAEEESFADEFISVEDGPMDGYTTGDAEDMLDGVGDAFESELGLDSMMGDDDDDGFDY